MARTLFVREIIVTSGEPDGCPRCGRTDRLERDMVREQRSGGRTLLCGRCEALVVITPHNIRQVDLAAAAADDTIMLKEPHLIRRLGA